MNPYLSIESRLRRIARIDSMFQTSSATTYTTSVCLVGGEWYVACGQYRLSANSIDEALGKLEDVWRRKLEQLHTIRMELENHDPEAGILP